MDKFTISQKQDLIEIDKIKKLLIKNSPLKFGDLGVVRFLIKYYNENNSNL